MKILFLTLNQIQQGSYWRGYHLAYHLAAKGHEVTLIATSKQNRFAFLSSQEGNLELIQSPDLWTGMLRSGYDPWNTLQRIRWVNNRRYDLVHAIEARPTVVYPARIAARNSQAPLLFDWADWFGTGGSVEERTNPTLKSLLRPVETYFEEHFRPNADGNTVINAALYQRAIRLGVNPSRMLILPNGADTQRIRPVPKSIARAKYGLPQEGKIIGYAGTIFRQDAELMAQAFDILQGTLPNTRLLVMGRCPIDLRGYVNNPELVKMTGAVEDDEFVYRMATCDLFWLPFTDSVANRGRTPLKFTDYLAAGRPIVATAGGVLKHLFKDGEVGFLTPPDPQNFSNATIALLQNPNQMDEMGIRAREVAEKIYDWGALSDQLLCFYQRILDQKRPS